VWLHPASASVLDGGRGLCGALIALQLEKEHHYTLNRGVDGPQSHSGCCGEEKTLLGLPGTVLYFLVVEPMSCSLYQLSYVNLIALK